MDGFAGVWLKSPQPLTIAGMPKLLRRLPRLMTHAKPLLQVYRPGESIYVDGEPVQRNPSQFYMRALVTPITGRNQLILPEGDRIEERYTIYQDPSQTQSAPGRQPAPGNLLVNDKVLINGTPCVVEQSKDWLGRYVEAQAVKIDVSKSKKIDFPELPADGR